MCFIQAFPKIITRRNKIHPVVLSFALFFPNSNKVVSSTEIYLMGLKGLFDGNYQMGVLMCGNLNLSIQVGAKFVENNM